MGLTGLDWIAGNVEDSSGLLGLNGKALPVGRQARLVFPIPF